MARYRPYPEAYSPWPILAWRTWNVMPDGDRARPRWDARPVLQGAYGRTWYSSYMEAECYCSVKHARPHEVADWESICGIYAYKDEYMQWSLLRRGGVEGLFLGLVALSDVIEHDVGYRAKHARILAGYLYGPTRTFYRDPWSTYKAIRDNIAYYYQLDMCRSIDALRSVHDYFTNHPDRIPEVTNESDRQAPATGTPDEAARAYRASNVTVYFTTSDISPTFTDPAV